MKRRIFAKLAGLSAMAIGTTGFIRYDGKSYVGDCETTTDILGPFYRPDSPVRNNLVIKGTPGDIVELAGTVKHKDCVTPYNGAKVELWHCSADEIYDNDSDEFLYRGTTFCDEKGNYSFTTQMPVPYDIGGGTYRPAHFHMLISAPGYQSFVTQIYFTGDPWLEKDSSSASPSAAGRILDVKEADGIKKITFDVNMNVRLLASDFALDRIVGSYTSEGKGGLELFKQDDALWLKNEVFGLKFDYTGNNQFEYSGLPSGESWKLHFDLQKNSAVKVTETSVRGRGVKKVSVYTKN